MKPLKMCASLSLLVGLSTAFAEKGGQNCIVQLQPVQPGDHVSWSKDLGCFSTFAEAIKKATGVEISPNVTPATITEADISSPRATAYIVGIDYDQSSYQGDSVTFITDNPQVCYDGSVYIANEPSEFDDRMSSTRVSTSSGCTINESYYGYNQTGDLISCTPDCATLDSGDDNQASSKRWYRE